MTKRFVSLPVVESSIYIFGGHQRTVPGGWSFFEQKHQVFELMCTIEGNQTTEIKGVSEYTYGPGDAMIISPGTLHTNWNTSKTDEMTYITFHFNIESLELKSEIISTMANKVLKADTEIAQLAMQTAQQMVSDSEKDDLSSEKLKIKVQINLLKFLHGLMIYNEHQDGSQSKFSEREAQTAREIATMIEDKTEQDELSHFSFGDICRELGISQGHGHRVFKKVYGITPLHYADEQKYRKAKLLLGSPENSIEEVAYKMGASSISNFSKQFKKWSGITPSKYQRQMIGKRSVKNVKEGGYFE
ncbi:AraC family transcriptional regulator [Secundilactobacillus yichangensis]|uniref:AraC family transcriptional regulator n=1 Tax=Secundilactobacillus yichangensis TaxID=2799580 RepID=UPI001F26CDBC|nr:AraC family transcriptional regulator [Secundilactobacillus yichangensis]